VRSAGASAIHGKMEHGPAFVSSQSTLALASAIIYSVTVMVQRSGSRIAAAKRRQSPKARRPTASHTDSS